MQRIIFNICAFIYVAFFTLIACRNDHAQTPPSEDNSHMTESARLDSLATDLEETTKIIEEQTKELQHALEAL